MSPEQVETQGLTFVLIVPDNYSRRPSSTKEMSRQPAGAEPPSADLKPTVACAQAREMMLALRFSAPKKEVADGKWAPPRVKRV